MSDKSNTVETFSEKIMRMFLPIRRRRSERTIKETDIETVDPLERFEKAIVKDSEAKGKTKLEEPRSKEQED